VVAIKNRPNTKLAEKPRMADFALWILAAEKALGWPEGAFLAAYNRNRGGANSLALESSIIAPWIIALMDQKDTWNGIARSFLRNWKAGRTRKLANSRIGPLAHGNYRENCVGWHLISGVKASKWYSGVIPRRGLR
jgi:hypothetical protein